VLGQQTEIDVYSEEIKDAVRVARNAVRHAKDNGHDVVVIDTAGRLHIDEEMMTEVANVAKAVTPHQIYLVCDAMTGQDAVNSAKEFNERLELDGVILTKLDGDARGGAALSIRAVTGKPIKLVGLGEKLDALEVFHPDRMAQRILGMGDVLSLIEKAEAALDQEDAQRMEQQLRKEGFTLETFRDQLQTIKKMGSLESLLKMIPGAGKAMKQMQGMQLPDKEMKKIEAIINSMTPRERRDQKILNGSRRLRIARGSGTTVQDVNQLMKRFTEAQNMMKKLQKMGPKGMKGLLGPGGKMPF
jgi:signal recognition particle subunit SRP54